MYEFEDQSRLSRPRHLPSSLVPPSRSTSVPPTTDGRESNGASQYALPREDHRRSASPAGSLIGVEPPTLNPPHIPQQPQPHRGGAGGPLAGHPPRSMSPRYFRPPPGVGPPHFRGPGPPWGRGPRPPFDPRFSPRGPPRRHPMGPRGPPGYRSRMPGMHIFVFDITKLQDFFLEPPPLRFENNLVPNYLRSCKKQRKVIGDYYVIADHFCVKFSRDRDTIELVNPVTFPNM